MEERPIGTIGPKAMVEVLQPGEEKNYAQFADGMVRLPLPIEKLEPGEVLCIETSKERRYVLFPDGSIWRLRKLKARMEPIR